MHYTSAVLHKKYKLLIKLVHIKLLLYTSMQHRSYSHSEIDSFPGHFCCCSVQQCCNIYIYIYLAEHHLCKPISNCTGARLVDSENYIHPGNALEHSTHPGQTSFTKGSKNKDFSCQSHIFGEM